MSAHPFADAIAILEEHYYGPVQLAEWLTTPHELLDGLTPIDVLSAGGSEKLLAIVRQLDNGVYI